MGSKGNGISLQDTENFDLAVETEEGHTKRERGHTKTGRLCENCPLVLRSEAGIDIHFDLTLYLVICFLDYAPLDIYP